MIGRLKGLLVYKAPPQLMVDVGGVGYELSAPMSTFYDLPDVGREVVLFTHYAVKEDGVALYGFLTEAERRLFREVQKVTGVGAKIALSVLSGASVDDFARLVQSGDITALTRLPGVGKKTAERICVELRDRLPKTIDAAPPSPGDSLREDLVSALANLGYHRQAIDKVLDKVLGAKSDARFEDILRAALKDLSRA